jgi:hypothetical protein
LASGGTLTATVADGQLRLTAADAKGLETLFNSPTTERSRKLEARTSAIVDSYIKGNYESLIEAMISRPDPQRFAAREQQQWKNWESKYGTFKGFTIIGTTPEPMDDAAVNVRLEFERGSVINQFVWFPRGLDGMRILDGAPGILFKPSSGSEFVSFNLATGTLLRASFNTGDGKVTGFTLQSGNNAVIASRSN